MQSRALTHYPLQVYREGEKRLRNPITKAHFKNLPEERVRLKVIEFLHHELKWSLNRISSETALSTDHKDSKSRADIICYDDNLKPHILIECKADHIVLDNAVAKQAAQYNQSLEAPFMLLTNGMQDYWFDLRNDNSVLDKIPFEHESFNNYHSWDYWTDRGFFGSKLNDSISEWMLSESEVLYKQNVTPEKLHYFNFEGAPVDFHLQGYYKVIPYSQKHRFAFAFCSTPEQGTKLNMVYNKEGKNKAIISVDMMLLQSGNESNALYYSDRGYTNADLRSILTDDFDYSLKDKAEDLYNFILRQS